MHPFVGKLPWRRNRTPRSSEGAVFPPRLGAVIGATTDELLVVSGRQQRWPDPLRSVRVDRSSVSVKSARPRRAGRSTEVPVGRPAKRGARPVSGVMGGDPLEFEFVPSALIGPETSFPCAKSVPIPGGWQRPVSAGRAARSAPRERQPSSPGDRRVGGSAGSGTWRGTKGLTKLHLTDHLARAWSSGSADACCVPRSQRWRRRRRPSLAGRVGRHIGLGWMPVVTVIRGALDSLGCWRSFGNGWSGRTST